MKPIVTKDTIVIVSEKKYTSVDAACVAHIKAALEGSIKEKIRKMEFENKKNARDYHLDYNQAYFRGMYACLDIFADTLDKCAPDHPIYKAMTECIEIRREFEKLSRT